MSDNKEKENKSIFSKIVDSASDALLNYQIKKAKAIFDLEKAKGLSDETEFYFKSVTEDPTYKINSQGYKEKPHRIMDSHLKQMSYKDSIVSAVIQTRQNQVSNFSKLVDSKKEKGFMIVLKDEEAMLRKIKEKLALENQNEVDADSDSELDIDVMKADGMDQDQNQDPAAEQANDQIEADNQSKSDDDVEKYNWELERKAKDMLEDEIRDRRKKVEDFILYCGLLDNRPFETKKWNFDTCLRAWVRDTLTLDKMTTEIVPNQVGKPHHFFPNDASTIKFASPSLKRYKAFPGAQTNVDFLYPEKHVQALEKRDALELDEELLEAEKYKYVQVVKGRIERAFTEDELKLGIRNMTTDIYNNGYGISELELLVSIVASHLNTEYYNKAYFTQGFSAKGILHLKAAIPRRKLETIRQQWHHMIKGARNSFQTPIFAGMDEVKWIPLTQNHSDIEFQGWLNYLIKVICAIYQIDPAEIGFPMKDIGSGGGISGDNTEEKLSHSKDKGLYPLLRFIENYVNINIIDSIDSDFCIEFTGVDEASKKFELERQEKEVKIKKTINEIRAEDGLPPLPGCDALVLDPVYFQWYSQFSEEGRKLAKENAQNQMGGQPQGPFESAGLQEDQVDSMLDTPDEQSPDMEKSLRIEYYKLEK